MKKIILSLLILISNLYVLFSETIIQINNRKIIFEEYKIENIIEVFGQPIKKSVIPFEYNSDWDTICYEYESLTVFTSRITKAPYKIEISGEPFSLNFNGKIINSGVSKSSIEELIGNLTLVKENTYFCEFQDFIDAYFIFENNKLCSSLIEYTPMD